MPITALTRVRYGNYRTSPPPNHTEPIAGTLRTSHLGQASDTFWITDIGGWIGKGEATAGTTRLAVYTVGAFPSSTVPGALRAATDSHTLSTLYTDNSGGAGVTYPIHSSSLIDNGIRPYYPWINAGWVYGAGALNASRALGVGYTNPGAWSGDLNFYNKSGLATLPDPFTLSSTAIGAGRLTYWVEGYINTPPEVPQTISPTGTVTSLTPTFSGEFRDYCGVWGAGVGGFDFGDQLTRYQIQLRAVGSTNLMWNSTYTATAGEVTADQISRVYGGSTLSRGQSYEYRMRVYDIPGAASEWTHWEAFFLADAGMITLDGTPTGKQTTINPTPFQGKWHHASGLSMTNVRVYLYDSDGSTLLQASPSIAKAAASSAFPGTPFNVTWAETTFTDLAWGHTYLYAMDGRDSNGDWSNIYIGDGFVTDFPPTIPSAPTPTNSTLYSTPPLLSYVMTDPDDTVSGLTSWFFWKPDGIDHDLVTQGNLGAYNSTTKRHELQLVSNDMKVNELQRVAIASTAAPTGGTFTLTFNGQTTAGIAHNAAAIDVENALVALSNIAGGEVYVEAVATRDWRVVFRNGLGRADQPQMTINVAGLTGGSGHSGTVVTEVAGGFYYGVWSWYGYGSDGTIYSGGTTNAVDASRSPSALFTYHQGPTVTIASPSNGATITGASFSVSWTTTDQQKKRVILYEQGTANIRYNSGLITSTVNNHTVPNGSYDNGETYDVYVYVEDSVSASGSSSVTVLIDFPPGAALTNVQAVTEGVGIDPTDTRVRVSWDPTTYPQVDVGSGAFQEYVVKRICDEGIDTAWVEVMRSANPNNTVFFDEFLQSNCTATYRVYQVVTLGGVELEATYVDVTATLTLGRYTVLTAVLGGETYRATLTNVTAKAYGRQRSEASFRSPNGGASVSIVGVDLDRTLAVEAAIISDQIATAQDRKLAFEALDAEGVTVCIRDGKTGDPLKLFGRITDPVITAQMGDTTGSWYTLAFTFTTERFTEGV